MVVNVYAVVTILQARNATHADIFLSAYDLFYGPALIWYRAVKREIRTWEELVSELKEEYAPRDYIDRLWDEIRRRTQGPTEGIGAYIAVMKNYFYRLPTPPSETEMLAILMKNLNPYYLDRLALKDVTSIKELLNLGRRLEEVKWRVDVHRPPPMGSKGLLEPDLGYQPTIRKQVAVSQINNTGPAVQRYRGRFRCWNCGNEGHSFRSCRAVKTKFCERCGKKDVEKDNCLRCNGSGNDQAGQI